MLGQLEWGKQKKEQTNYGKNFLLMSKKIMNHSNVFAVLQTILWKNSHEERDKKLINSFIQKEGDKEAYTEIIDLTTNS